MIRACGAFKIVFSKKFSKIKQDLSRSQLSTDPSSLAANMVEEPFGGFRIVIPNHQ